MENYIPYIRTITVSCSSARLTDIDNQIHDNNILSKQYPAGTWLLNANIVIAKEATFHIDSTDTKWLKIVSDQAVAPVPYNIDVHGSLKIDSVKITSWDPTIKAVIEQGVRGKPITRPDETIRYPFKVTHAFEFIARLLSLEDLNKTVYIVTIVTTVVIAMIP